MLAGEVGACEDGLDRSDAALEGDNESLGFLAGVIRPLGMGLRGELRRWTMSLGGLLLSSELLSGELLLVLKEVRLHLYLLGGRVLRLSIRVSWLWRRWEKNDDVSAGKIVERGGVRTWIPRSDCGS